MNLREALRRSVGGESLTRAEARAVFANALLEGSEPIELAGLLSSLATRGESTDELAGAAQALRDAMRPFEHEFADAIDTCGTGGDALGLFNVSTAAAIVAAACGARVIKHGNRAASSQSGSADFLETAGLPLDLAPQAARTVLEEVGITFLFAPSYHPSLRAAAGVRRALGVRTIFNWLGPLANPARVRRQLLGVADARRVHSIGEVLAALGVERALVVHGDGGADELTLGEHNCVQVVGDVRFALERLEFERADLAELRGGDARHNLALFERVLDGHRSPLAEAIALNAAAALCVADRARDARDGLDQARAALRSGAARTTFVRWIELARRVGGVR